MSLSSKDPQEKVVVTFDFSNVAGVVQSPVLTIKEVGNDIDLSGTMFTGVTQIQSGNKIMKMVQGGESGKKYDIRCQVDVELTGERFVAKDVLPVKTL